jgi:flagellar hook-basal body complex protein FliE
MNESFGTKDSSATSASKDSGFLNLLEDGIKEVNQQIKASEKASMDLVSGRSSNIHETMLAVSRAEIGFNMLVQLRNKALEAYQEVMRMQV